MQLKERLEEAIAKQYFPGAVVGVVHRNGDRLIEAAGSGTYDSRAEAVTADSVYDTASITKSIPTSCLALQLVEQGKIRLTDKLITYLPELAHEYREQVTIEHVLRQSLVYDLRLSSLKNDPPEDILQAILGAALKAQPGEQVYHSNATSILLTLLLERVTGKELDVLAQEAFFDPLGMKATTFHPTEAVPTEYDYWRERTIQGEIHDESAHALRDLLVVGSAGLFSTASDLLTFLEMLLNKGELHGQRYFSASMVESMGTGLGWEFDRLYMGLEHTPRSFGKRGFTGCMVVVDVEKDLGVVLLSNSTYPLRKSEQNHQNDNDEVRTDIMNLAWKL